MVDVCFLAGRCWSGTSRFQITPSTVIEKYNFHQLGMLSMVRFCCSRLVRIASDFLGNSFVRGNKIIVDPVEGCLFEVLK